MTHQSCKYNRKYDTPLSNVTTLWKYNDIASKLMSEYKYNGVTEIIDLFQELIAERFDHLEISQIFDQQNIFMTNIPQHIFRTRERGFEPTKEICKVLCNLLEHTAYIPDLLVKSRNNKRQATLDHQKRQKNTERLYMNNKELLGQLPQDAHLVIVDDVTTSGATIRNAAIAIKEMRPDIKLSGLTLFTARK